MAKSDYDVLALRMDVSIPPRTEAQLRRTIEKISPGVRRQLSNDLRSSLKPIAARVAQGVPTQAPLSGMTERWGSASAVVKTYPKGRPGRAIATISVSGDASRFARLLSITELAGTVTKGYSKRGEKMINELQERYPLVGKGGRFIWKAWLKNRPEAVGLAIASINRFVEKFNKR